jgi:tRNA threonylcarbamoyladenosine biosynthesis protein TsaB
MLLAVDTSTSQVGLALYDGDQVLGEMTWTTKQHHTTELSPGSFWTFESLRRFHGHGQRFGRCHRTGSFTSLRVGLSLVKGIALARRLP